MAGGVGDAISFLISATVRFRINSDGCGGVTGSVNSHLRHRVLKPIRRGMRASHASIAERGELGKISAVEKFSGRSRRAMASGDSLRRKGSTEFKSAC